MGDLYIVYRIPCFLVKYKTDISLIYPTKVSKKDVARHVVAIPDKNNQCVMFYSCMRIQELTIILVILYGVANVKIRQLDLGGLVVFTPLK